MEMHVWCKYNASEEGGALWNMKWQPKLFLADIVVYHCYHQEVLNFLVTCPIMREFTGISLHAFPHPISAMTPLVESFNSEYSEYYHIIFTFNTNSADQPPHEGQPPFSYWMAKGLLQGGPLESLQRLAFLEPTPCSSGPSVSLLCTSTPHWLWPKTAHLMPPHCLFQRHRGLSNQVQHNWPYPSWPL